MNASNPSYVNLEVDGLVVCDEGGGVLTWHLRRSDGMIRYAACHGPEGMLSPSQGLAGGKYPWPEHVGLSTVVDH